MNPSDPVVPDGEDPDDPGISEAVGADPYGDEPYGDEPYGADPGRVVGPYIVVPVDPYDPSVVSDPIVPTVV